MHLRSSRLYLGAWIYAHHRNFRRSKPASRYAKNRSKKPRHTDTSVGGNISSFKYNHSISKTPPLRYRGNAHPVTGCVQSLFLTSHDFQCSFTLRFFVRYKLSHTFEGNSLCDIHTALNVFIVLPWAAFGIMI